MNVLIFVVLVAAMISGCGYTKPQIKEMINEEMQTQDYKAKRDYATKDDLSNVKRQLNSKIEQSMLFHLIDDIHGCECK